MLGDGHILVVIHLRLSLKWYLQTIRKAWHVWTRDLPSVWRWGRLYMQPVFCHEILSDKAASTGSICGLEYVSRRSLRISLPSHLILRIVRGPDELGLVGTDIILIRRGLHTVSGRCHTFWHARKLRNAKRARYCLRTPQTVARVSRHQFEAWALILSAEEQLMHNYVEIS